jgi:hypothetical protein
VEDFIQLPVILLRNSEPPRGLCVVEDQP